MTATRGLQPTTDDLADVTVIGREEIARAGVQSFAELLQRQPGAEIVQNGGMWRARIRVSPQAIIQVIKEYERLSPQERGQIKNPAGWATNQYSIFGGKPLAPPKA